MLTAESKLGTAKDILSAVGSIATTTFVLYNILPLEFRDCIFDYIFSTAGSFLSTFSRSLTMVIDELDGLNINEIYQAAETYLGSKDSPKARLLKISRPEKEKHFKITVGKGQVIPDTYSGQKFKWVWKSKKTNSKGLHISIGSDEGSKSEVRSFELTFHMKNRDLVVNSYLPYIINEARKKKMEKKTLKLFASDCKEKSMFDVNDVWTPVTFDHPATFKTLAMDADQKEMIMKDLEKFVGRKEYYRKVGKAWKRGYLLHGPPGTGKSSLIAAMANYLNFDVYDLELDGVKSNSQLRTLLVATGNKSILVIEDIDCSVDLQEKLTNREIADSLLEFEEEEESLPIPREGKGKSKVTLSGLLNFVDGLWSSCGDERIIVFTTNRVEKLDPALLRPGRMDVHVNMSYCTPGGFRLLASNYLGIEEHALFGEIEGEIGKAKTTPAEVAEELLKNGDDPDAALRGLVDFIRKKVKKNGEEMEAEVGDEDEDDDEEDIN